LLKNINIGCITAINSLFLRSKSNVNNMKFIKNTVLASMCLFLTVATTSCARKNSTGCPGWSKVKYEQTTKKHV